VTIAAILVAFGVVAIVFLLVVARGQAREISKIEDLPGRTRPVDIEAFRNLMDPAEERYLREQLPPREFRRVHRLRMLAAVEYVERAAANAAILIRLGEAARTSADPELARAGQRLADTALRVRVYALLVETKLYIAAVLPGANLSLAPLVDRYAGMTDVAGTLTRLQNPSMAGRIAAEL
jgi:hypothetical protein